MLRVDKETNEKSLIIDNVDTTHIAMLQRALQEDDIGESISTNEIGTEQIFIETIPFDYLYKEDENLDGWDFDESLNKNIH
jgi:hypothetical protein